MNIIDPAIDFLELVLLLVVVCSICFNLIIPVVDLSREVKYQTYYDKTASIVEGEKSINTDITGYTAAEVSLMVASQSHYMVSPMIINNIEDLDALEVENNKIKVFDTTPVYFKIGGTTTDLAENGQYDITVASQVFNLIKAWCVSNGINMNSANPPKFKVSFCMGDDPSVVDNHYLLYYINEEGKNDVLIPCE